MLNVTLMKLVMFVIVKARWIGEVVAAVMADLGERVEFLVGEEEQEWFLSAMVRQRDYCACEGEGRLAYHI
jgi:hypothetical protein